jgi:FixJ family two-component response regulator
VLEQGAVECLFKPFSDTALLDALHAALRQAELPAPPAENIQ